MKVLYKVSIFKDKADGRYEQGLSVNGNFVYLTQTYEDAQAKVQEEKKNHNKVAWLTDSINDIVQLYGAAYTINITKVIIDDEVIKEVWIDQSMAFVPITED